MAAITTDPVFTCDPTSSGTVPSARSLSSRDSGALVPNPSYPSCRRSSSFTVLRRSLKTSVNDCQTRGSATRSCGRRGPATLGSTASRASSRVSLNTGSGSASVRNRPCSFV